MQNQNKIVVELDNRAFKAEDLVKNVIDKLTAEGHTCELQAMGSMPVLSVDGELFRATVTSAVGAYVGVQKVLLTKEKK